MRVYRGQQGPRSPAMAALGVQAQGWEEALDESTLKWTCEPKVEG